MNARLPDWNAGVDDCLIELPGETLEALGGRVEPGDHRRLRRLGAIRGYDTRLLQGGELRLESLQFFLDLRELIGDCQRGHDRETRIADLAEARPQLTDAPVELLGESGETRLFAGLAGHAELAAVDGDVDLRHGTSALVRREYGADRVDGGIEPLGDLAIGCLQRPIARGRGVELRGKARAIGAERMQLSVECLLAAIRLVPPLHGSRKRIEREGKTFAGGLDGARFRHSRPTPSLGELHNRFVSPMAGEIFCIGNQLEEE